MNLLRSSLLILGVCFFGNTFAKNNFPVGLDSHFAFNRWNYMMASSFDNLAENCYQNPWTDSCMKNMFPQYYLSYPEFINADVLSVDSTSFLPICANCSDNMKSTIDNVTFNMHYAIPLDTSKIPVTDIKDDSPVKVSSKVVKEKYEFVPLSEFTNLKPLPLYPKPITGMSKRCGNFISRKGELGSYGKAVIKYIRNYDAFYNPKSKNVTSICKNWNTMTNKQKEIFWVWAFASIAHTESSCNPKTLVSGMPGRKAAGLLQIEYTKRYRKAAARPKVCTELTQDETLGVKANVRCSVAMMAGFINKKSWNFLFDKKTYWHRLRSGTNEVKKHLNKNPVCGK